MGMTYFFNCAFLTLVSPLVTTEESFSNFRPLAQFTTSRSRSPNEASITTLSRSTDERMGGKTTSSVPAPYLQLPTFLHSRVPLVDKEHFSPASGTGKERLPDRIIEILLPVSPSQKTSGPQSRPHGVIIFCNVNKMHVQVKKSILGSVGSPSRLTLGTCEANKYTNDSLYFQYDLGLCGSKRSIVNDRVAYSNTLRYEPHMLPGPIRRAVPFTLPVDCHFNRYHYSYKIGYTPKMEMGKVFKPMRNRANFMLTSRNALWERLAPLDGYVMGQPMYFQAEAPFMSKDGRLYVHSCHVTIKRSHTSTPQFKVVENFGCMVESKNSRSKFFQYSRNVVRFAVDAFLFQGMTGRRLYMHCTMSLGSSVPSPTAKACNYDTKAGRWKELYGSASVCSCCDSKCPSAASAATKMVSSKPWSALTTEEATTTTTPPQQEGEEVEGRVEVVEMEGPLRGMKQMAVETGERPVKGFAVVEEEPVSEPHRVFEEIFDFGK